MGSTTLENDKKTLEKKTRNRSFVREVKNKRPLRNFEKHLKEFSNGFKLYLSSNQFADVKDRVMILLNQADALFEKLLEHLCSLAMTQQQEDKYITVINQYRETFRQLKVGYSSNEDMLLVNEIDNQNKLNCDKKDKNSFLFENFKTNIGVVFKKSIHEISK